MIAIQAFTTTDTDKADIKLTMYCEYPLSCISNDFKVVQSYVVYQKTNAELLVRIECDISIKYKKFQLKAFQKKAIQKSAIKM